MPIMGRIRTVFTGVAGTPWYSNIYVLGTEDDAAAQVDAVGEFWATVSALMTGVVDWTVEGDVAQIDSATGDLVGVTSETPVSGSGTNAGDPLPYANQALVNWSTSVFAGGRNIKGKTFIPALCEDSNSVGTLLSASDGVITDAANALVAALNGSMVIYSPTNALAAEVTGASVPSKFAVLRSRRD